MTRNLNNIPPELQVSILGSCEDLDDAICLSQVCQDLRQAFHIDRRRIEKHIIVSYQVLNTDSEGGMPQLTNNTTDHLPRPHLRLLPLETIGNA